MSFTFVTALYEIQREKYDKRSYNTYQEWFSRTLMIPVPMIIYTEEKNRGIVESIRKDLPTQTIYTPLDKVPLYYTVPSVKNIIEHTEFKYRIKHPNGLENKCYEYIPIINSKFKWLSDAIEENPFNTELFFWIDAGLSRFITFDIASNTFNYPLIASLNTKVYFQIGKKKELTDILTNPSAINSYIGTNTNFIMAGFFGGNRELLLKICKEAYELYTTEYINKGQIDNEQTLIGYVLPKYKDLLYFIDSHPTQEYINYYIFCDRL